MKRSNIICLFLTIFTFTFLTAKSQEAAKEDTLPRVIEQLQSDVALLKNLKITGYIQAQAQFADSTGALTDMQAGAFPKGSDQRFAIRRGRLKFVYSSNPLSQYAMQIDVNETGVKTKEVYAKFAEPFFKTFALTAGLQNRPYGFEIGYSSGDLETPERSRTEQSLFKDEYDLGANLTIQAPKTSRYNWVKLDLGFFSGGLENNSPMDFKKTKDFIGRINVSKTFLNESLKVSGDLSYYHGGVPTNSKKISKIQDVGGVTKFVSKAVDSLSNCLREYYGFDAQVTYATPFGLTTLRGEFTQGQQASASGDIKNPTALTANLYVRKVQGFYFMWVQNIGQSRHSFVLRYDAFDPNTKASGTQITKAAGFTSSDVKYSDLGLGYTLRIDANTKFLVYYDINTNEKTGLTGYTKDVKDNVWTFRVQFKF